MNRFIGRQRLRFRLANRQDINDDSLVDAWLNDGLTELTTRRMEIQELQGSESAFGTQIGVTAYQRPAGAFVVRYLEDTTNGQVLTRFPSGLPEFLRAKNAAPSGGPPSQFMEWGEQILILPVPNVADIQLVPWTYKIATWGVDPSDEPTLRPTWDRGILLCAEMIALQDLGDEERAIEVERELIDWLARRDTPLRQATRVTAPARGIQPAGATQRDPRTGV